MKRLIILLGYQSIQMNNETEIDIIQWILSLTSSLVWTARLWNRAMGYIFSCSFYSLLTLKVSFQKRRTTFVLSHLCTRFMGFTKHLYFFLWYYLKRITFAYTCIIAKAVSNSRYFSDSADRRNWSHFGLQVDLTIQSKILKSGGGALVWKVWPSMASSCIDRGGVYNVIHIHPHLWDLLLANFTCHLYDSWLG